MERREDWWKTFFHGLALDLWRAACPPEASQRQAGEIHSALTLHPGQRVLDVPCGNGRLALALARMRLSVTGLDYAADFVEEGRADAKRCGIEVELVQGDMRELPWKAEFDAAFCVGNSFGYLDDAGNAAFLAGVARALKPRGRFLLEYPMVAELALRREPKRDWHRFGDLIMLSDSTVDAERGRIDTTYGFLRLGGGVLESAVASYRVYTCRETLDLLRAAGFSDVEAWGGLDASPYEPRTTPLYALATR